MVETESGQSQEERSNEFGEILASESGFNDDLDVKHEEEDGIQNDLSISSLGVFKEMKMPSNEIQNGGGEIGFRRTC